MKLPKPKGRQQEVVYLPATGHTAVLGTAGSGKTSMAILRGVYLQNHFTNTNEKTLLLTFNRMLVSYMKAFEESNVKGLIIDNYHKIARGFLTGRGKLGYNSILKSHPRKDMIKASLENMRQKESNKFLDRDFNFFVEEIIWIESFGLRTLDNYESILRVGRKSTRINRDQRKYVWLVYDEYKRIRKRNGFNYDWDDLALTVQDELKHHNDDWYFRHIIIDEGQDFSPSMLRSLANAVPQNGSLTFFGDVAQQIYGSRLTWKDAGLKPPKVWQFKENYRNTREIAELAVELTKSDYFKDETDLVLPNIIKAKTSPPSLLKFNDARKEYEWIKQKVVEMGEVQQVAVLVRKRSSVSTIINDLRKLDKRVAIKELHHDRGTYIPEQGIMVGTYHSAKGLEFDTVFMPFLSKINWPFGERVNEIGEDDTCVEDIKLIYVGITRAKSRLIISYTNEPTKLIPLDLKFYNFKEVK